MTHLLFALTVSFTATFASANPPENCFELVQQNLQWRLDRLRAETTLPMTEDFLYKDPRFRNFPAISWQSNIKWCPKMETLTAATDFLVEVGFSRERMEDYFKFFIFMTNDPKLNDKLAVRKYQIGSTWSRPELTPADLETPLLREMFHAAGTALLDDNGKASFSSAIYLGMLAGTEVVAIPYHTLTQAKTDGTLHQCSDLKFVFPAVKQKPIPGGETLATLPEADLVFCGISTRGLDSRLKPLIPDFNRHPKDTPLATMGRGGAQNPKIKITYDISDECRTLDTEPGLKVNRNYPNSWRMAMGCDVSQGDSGSPVVERATGKWLGFVTSTKIHTFAARAEAAMTGGLTGEALLRETSHLMPLWKVKEVAETRRLTADPDSIGKAVLDAFLAMAPEEPARR